MHNRQHLWSHVWRSYLVPRQAKYVSGRPQDCVATCLRWTPDGITSYHLWIQRTICLYRMAGTCVNNGTCKWLHPNYLDILEALNRLVCPSRWWTRKRGKRLVAQWICCERQNMFRTAPATRGWPQFETTRPSAFQEWHAVLVIWLKLCDHTAMIVTCECPSMYLSCTCSEIRTERWSGKYMCIAFQRRYHCLEQRGTTISCCVLAWRAATSCFPTGGLVTSPWPFNRETFCLKWSVPTAFDSVRPNWRCVFKLRLDRLDAFRPRVAAPWCRLRPKHAFFLRASDQNILKNNTVKNHLVDIVAKAWLSANMFSRNLNGFGHGFPSHHSVILYCLYRSTNCSAFPPFTRIYHSTDPPFLSLSYLCWFPRYFQCLTSCFPMFFPFPFW